MTNKEIRCYICGNRNAIERYSVVVISMNYFFDVLDLCEDCYNNETKVRNLVGVKK